VLVAAGLVIWGVLFRLPAPPRQTAADLVEHAKALDLDLVAFTQCLDSGHTRATVRADQDEGRRLGVRATPQFFLGRVRPDGGIDLVTRIRGAVGPEVFAEQLARTASAAGSPASASVWQPLATFGRRLRTMAGGLP
jgi:predicted DsbA family dithiol-disulfide isomerase